MNAKVALVLVATVIAIAILYLYSFGPLAGKRVALNQNPASLHPTQPESVALGSSETLFSTYHNKDSRENYYAIKLPQTWTVHAGQNPGSYLCSFSNGSGSVELMDVPDNTTLELYILSRDEPKLRKTVAGYKRSYYNSLLINKEQAYQLIYTTIAQGDDFKTIRTYVNGQDNAGLITLSASTNEFASDSSLFDLINSSFKWENK
jgi:hypothetical protein